MRSRWRSLPRGSTSGCELDRDRRTWQDCRVPYGEDMPRAHRSLGTSRMEALSDGVFGFAATLLVLDLAIHPPGTALEQVLHAWPSYLTYIVSFLTIGAAWLGHTALTDRL